MQMWLLSPFFTRPGILILGARKQTTREKSAYCTTEIEEKDPRSKNLQGPGADGEDAVYIGAAVLIHENLRSEME